MGDTWDDDDQDAANRKKAEMLTTIDKALVSLVISGISIANGMGWTDVSAEAANQVNMALSALVPVLVLLIPNKVKK